MKTTMLYHLLLAILSVSCFSAQDSYQASHPQYYLQCKCKLPNYLKYSSNTCNSCPLGYCLYWQSCQSDQIPIHNSQQSTHSKSFQGGQSKYLKHSKNKYSQQQPKSDSRDSFSQRTIQLLEKIEDNKCFEGGEIPRFLQSVSNCICAVDESNWQLSKNKYWQYDSPKDIEFKQYESEGEYLLNSGNCMLCWRIMCHYLYCFLSQCYICQPPQNFNCNDQGAKCKNSQLLDKSISQERCVKCQDDKNNSYAKVLPIVIMVLVAIGEAYAINLWLNPPQKQQSPILSQPNQQQQHTTVIKEKQQYAKNDNDNPNDQREPLQENQQQIQLIYLQNSK